MKKTISLFMILVAMSATANAQFFVEGNLRMSYNAGQSLFYTQLGETPSNIFFKVSPLVGYQLNEKIAVGAKASFVKIKENRTVLDPDTRNEVKVERREPEWSVAIFSRHKLFGLKKISFLVEGSVYDSELKRIDKSTSSSVYKFNETVSTIGVSLFPLVTYELAGKWSIIASGDFFRLDLSSVTTKNMDTGFHDKRNHFGFTGQSTLFKHLLGIRIGVIYHFKKSSK